MIRAWGTEDKRSSCIIDDSREERNHELLENINPDIIIEGLRQLFALNLQVDVLRKRTQSISGWFVDRGNYTKESLLIALLQFVKESMDPLHKQLAYSFGLQAAASQKTVRCDSLESLLLEGMGDGWSATRKICCQMMPAAIKSCQSFESLACSLFDNLLNRFNNSNNDWKFQDGMLLGLESLLLDFKDLLLLDSVRTAKTETLCIRFLSSSHISIREKCCSILWKLQRPGLCERLVEEMNRVTHPGHLEGILKVLECTIFVSPNLWNSLLPLLGHSASSVRQVCGTVVAQCAINLGNISELVDSLLTKMLDKCEWQFHEGGFFVLETVLASKILFSEEQVVAMFKVLSCSDGSGHFELDRIYGQVFPALTLHVLDQHETLWSFLWKNEEIREKTKVRLLNMYFKHSNNVGFRSHLDSALSVVDAFESVGYFDQIESLIRGQIACNNLRDINNEPIWDSLVVAGLESISKAETCDRIKYDDFLVSIAPIIVEYLETIENTERMIPFILQWTWMSLRTEHYSEFMSSFEIAVSKSPELPRLLRDPSKHLLFRLSTSESIRFMDSRAVSPFLRSTIMIARWVEDDQWASDIAVKIMKTFFVSPAQDPASTSDNDEWDSWDEESVPEVDSYSLLSLVAQLINTLTGDSFVSKWNNGIVPLLGDSETDYFALMNIHNC